MNGYKYEIVLRSQSGRIEYSNGTLKGVRGFFVDILMEKQNAGYKMKHYENSYSTNFSQVKFNEKLNTLDYDLNLLSDIRRNENMSEPICTYDPLQYCVAVPKKYVRKTFGYFFVSDFTPEMGFMCLGAIFLSLSIWSFIYYKKLSRSPNSAGHFLFGIFGFFVGQGVEFQKLCVLQTFLVQLFVYGLFFFSNLYTSLLVAFQGENRISLEISSFADIKKHNLPVRTPSQVYNIFNESDFDRGFMKQLIPGPNPYKMAEDIFNQEAIAARCTTLIAEREKTFRFARDLYYILDEKIILNFEYFYFNRLNPYRLKFQHYKNAVFEAGLEHYYYLTKGLCTLTTICLHITVFLVYFFLVIFSVLNFSR